MKKIFLNLVALLCMTVTFVQKANAWMDDNGYYWYKNKLSVYPVGTGLIYATADSPNSLPEAEQYKEELNLNCCTGWPGSQGGLFGEPIFDAIAKPTSDYNFIGWYSVGDDKNPGKLILKHNSEAWKYFYFGEEGYKEYLHNRYGEDWDRYAYDRIGDLEYYWTEVNDHDYYDYAPLNSIYAVLGKVNVDFIIDNIPEFAISESEGQIDKASLKEEVLELARWFTELSLFDVQISKPANDVGDEITLTFDASVEDKTFSSGVGFAFKYWTDSKGNKFYDRDLKLTVEGKDTYTCHFRLTGVADGIEKITGESESKTVIYDLNGRHLGSNTANLQPGCYIINRKVHIVK